MSLDYQKTRSALREESDKLARVRERILNRLTRVDQHIQAVTDAANALDRALDVKNSRIPEPAAVPAPSAVVPQPEFEITASIREILQGAARHLSAPHIRELLIERGWKAENYKNPSAVVHQVLKRLIKNGDVDFTQDWQNIKYYYDKRIVAEKRDRERAKEKEIAAARAETFSMLLDPCLKILRAHPKGISANRIARELRRIGVDMSCYNVPAVAINLALRDVPDVRRFKAEVDGIARTYYQLMEAKTNAVG